MSETHSGCRNVSHCHQQFFSELHSPGRSHYTNFVSFAVTVKPVHEFTSFPSKQCMHAACMLHTCCMHANVCACMPACMQYHLHACRNWLHACKSVCMHACMHAWKWICMHAQLNCIYAERHCSDSLFAYWYCDSCTFLIWGNKAWCLHPVAWVI